MTDRNTDAVGGAPARAEPDAHGQAALLLTESLLHTLVEARLLTPAEVVMTVRTASEVKREVATAAGESEGRMQASLPLLKSIGASFGTDGPVAANDGVDG